MSSNETKSGAIVPVFPTSNNPALTIGGRKFRFVAQVTRTVLQQIDEVPFYVEFQSRFTPSKMDPENSKFKDAKTGEGVLPDVADVLNLETGEYQILIGNAVMASELDRNYPDGGYVGRMFGIMRGRSEMDKRYKTYRIIEAKPETDAAGHVAGMTPQKEIDATDKAAIDRAKGAKVKAA